MKTFYIVEAGAELDEQISASAGELRLSSFKTFQREVFLDAVERLSASLFASVRSPFWNATTLATKNPINHYELFTDLAWLSVCPEFIDVPGDRLVVRGLTRSGVKTLSAAIQKNAASHPSRGRCQVIPVFARQSRLRSSFVFLMLRGARNLVRYTYWTLRRKSFAASLSKIKKQGSALFLRSYFFPQTERSFQEPYFSKLTAHLRSQKKDYSLLLGHFDPALTGVQANKASKFDEGTFFIEHFIKTSEVFKNLFYCAFLLPVSWALKIKKRRVFFASFDVTALVLEHLFEEQSRGAFFNETLFYFAGRNFAATSGCTTLLYPFENLSWERLFLSGVYEVNPEFRAIGYQHASLTPLSLMTKHRESLYGARVPLPKKIISTGKKALELLVKDFGYAKERVVAGCALRQSTRPAPMPIDENQKFDSDVLVLMSSVKDMSDVMHFLSKTNLSAAKWPSIRLRPHPLFEAEFQKLSAKIGLPSNFARDGFASLSDSVKRAQVVVYSASTAAIEAVFFKELMLVNLDIDEVITCDPLYFTTNAKQVVCKPHDFESALESAIAAAKSGKLHEPYLQLLDELKDYFAEPTSEALRHFESALFEKSGPFPEGCVTLRS